MRKLIHHTWINLGFKRFQCSTCLCEKHYNDRLGVMMYRDRFDHILYRAPSCELPNIKLNKKNDTAYINAQSRTITTNVICNNMPSSYIYTTK
jgi:hypothetical protein